MDEYQHIVIDSEMGGDARLKGHRIAVYHIVQFQHRGFSVEEIAEEFDITTDEVTEALEYADDTERGSDEE